MQPMIVPDKTNQTHPISVIYCFPAIAKGLFLYIHSGTGGTVLRLDLVLKK